MNGARVGIYIDSRLRCWYLLGDHDLPWLNSQHRNAYSNNDEAQIWPRRLALPWEILACFKFYPPEVTTVPTNTNLCYVMVRLMATVVPRRTRNQCMSSTNCNSLRHFWCIPLLDLTVAEAPAWPTTRDLSEIERRRVWCLVSFYLNLASLTFGGVIDDTSVKHQKFPWTEFVPLSTSFKYIARYH